MADAIVIASGNLATSRRTIAGILGQLALLRVSQDQAVEIFAGTGLPQRALKEPDFPISLAQELSICSELVRLIGTTRSATSLFSEARQHIGIENLGVLGMAMRHAATALDALKVCVSFPQFTWGHSRMIVSEYSGTLLFTFTMDRPRLQDAAADHIDRLLEYCLVLVLVSSLRNIQDILDQDTVPRYITLPFAQPQDWSELEYDLPCPVKFSADNACLAYAGAVRELPLPRANPLAYRSFVSIAEKLSLMQAEDISLAERVTRWLWAYSPPLRRADVARQLAMSERSLTRQLHRENTSYAKLLAQVQQERAEKFLRNRALSVTDIAYRLGYAEPAAFTRAFTKWTGLSPLKWRKST